MMPPDHQWYHCIPYIKTNEMSCDITFHHTMPLALVLSCDVDSIINGTIVFLRSTLSKWSATWWLWSCDAIGISIMIQVALSMKHDTYASTTTSTGTSSHTIPLNNHVNKTYSVLSMVASLVSCDRKHITAIYITKTNMPIKCNICKLVHAQIWDNGVSIHTHCHI